MRNGLARQNKSSRANGNVYLKVHRTLTLTLNSEWVLTQYTYAVRTAARCSRERLASQSNIER